jgi:hypothetical protein
MFFLAFSFLVTKFITWRRNQYIPRKYINDLSPLELLISLLTHVLHNSEENIFILIRSEMSAEVISIFVKFSVFSCLPFMSVFNCMSFEMTVFSKIGMSILSYLLSFLKKTWILSGWRDGLFLLLTSRFHPLQWHRRCCSSFRTCVIKERGETFSDHVWSSSGVRWIETPEYIPSIS